jgi:LPXTG-site transpeptidase (sortase) family protein
VNAGSVLNVDPLLDSLADNGGPTNTHAVASALSSAYDASGGSATAGDQRGVSAVGTRDLGAFEYTGDDNLLVVVSSDPPDNSTQQNITQLKVTFSKAVVSGGGATAGDDPGNYLLMEKGANDTFDTLSCVGTAQTDDISINIDTVTYNAASFTATLNINGGTALPNGTYRLFICGTTSIFDLIGLELNGGLSDAQINFTVGNSPVVSAAEILPDTGFAPYRVTELPAQSANLAYTSTEVTLNIPKLGVEMPIVGVPLVDGEWDTAWLNGSAGWLEGSAFPTWAGNTVLTGHVWDAWNRPGVFNNLKDLQHGDQFTISAYGTVYTYEVRSSERVYANDLSVLAHSDYDTVTLLTCEGWSLWTGEYRYRRAVTAVLVSVK